VPGSLDEILVKPGERVEAHQKVGRLTNEDILYEVSELESQIKRTEARRQSLQKAQFSLKDRSAALELPEVLKSLSALREQLKQRQEDVKRLDLIAPTAGIVMPPPTCRAGRAARWSPTTWGPTWPATCGCSARSAIRTTGKPTS
jgi:multidrug efflux pump subunit AcrA (membrane-fusion protein)